MNKIQLKWSNCRGFTMVELMVAFAVSVILSLGIMQMVGMNKQAYLANQNTSHLQENGRFAVAMLRNSIRLAGDPGYVDITDPTVSITKGCINDLSPAITGCEGSAACAIANANRGDAMQGDTISILYKGPEGGTINCLGSAVAQGALMNEVYYVEGNNLSCWTPGSVPQPIVSGVENMQVLYGIDTNGDNNVDQYVTANNVIGTALSVRLGLLMVTTDAPVGVQRVTNLTVYNIAETMIGTTGAVQHAIDFRNRMALNINVAIRSCL